MMKRGIRKVRQSIRRRKRHKKTVNMDNSDQYSSLYLPDDKERHGIPQSYIGHDHYFSTSGNRQFLQSTWLKGIFSLLLFVSLTFLLQTDFSRLANTKQVVYQLLNKEFPFAKVNDWYVETFGQPFTFLLEGDRLAEQKGDLSLPVNGDVTEPFNLNGEGIMITPDESTIVSAFDRGIVIFAGNDQDTNKTVIIQHPDDRNTTYGFLSSVDVHLYQPIKAGSRIGTFSPTEESDTVYFSVEENDRFIDPIQVIQVDNHR